MSTAISFHRDDILLQGRFRRAKGGDAYLTVLLLHGSPGNTEDVLGLGERLSQRGCNVLAFNYSGTQKSQGHSSFANAQLDIAAAYRWLAETGEAGRVVLGGWSYGGGMALVYAANHPEVTAVFSIAGTDHGEFMREYASDDGYRQMVDGIFDEMARPGSVWRLAVGSTPREVLDSGISVDEFDLRRAAPDLADRHVLIVGGWDDLNVKIDSHLLPLYRALKSHGADNVGMIAFRDDHSFSKVREELAETILAWMGDLEWDPRTDRSRGAR